MGPALRPRPGHGHQALGRPAAAGQGTVGAEYRRHGIVRDCATSTGCISTWPQSASPPAGKPQSVPVEITCRGPFRFDMVRHVATFRDRVEVMKTQSLRPVRSARLRSLSLYFIQRPKSPAAQAAVKPDPAGSFDLAVRAGRSPRQSGRAHRAQPKGRGPRRADRV